MHQGRGERIRLPASTHPRKASLSPSEQTQFVSDLCYHKQVRVQTKNQDRYQRTIADVSLPDGKVLNY
jgi:endonuclease YncB( thermonuclease family)